jgi:hypothetical protein
MRGLEKEGFRKVYVLNSVEEVNAAMVVASRCEAEPGDSDSNARRRGSAFPAVKRIRPLGPVDLGSH